MEVDDNEQEGGKSKRKVIIERATTIEMPDAVPAPTTEASAETLADQQDPATTNTEVEEGQSAEVPDDDDIIL